MSIKKKLVEVRAVNQATGKKNHRVNCIYRLGEDTLVVVESYMDSKGLTNETQAIRELLQLGFINSVANGT